MANSPSILNGVGRVFAHFASPYQLSGRLNQMRLAEQPSTLIVIDFGYQGICDQREITRNHLYFSVTATRNQCQRPLHNTGIETGFREPSRICGNVATVKNLQICQNGAEMRCVALCLVGRQSNAAHCSGGGAEWDDMEIHKSLEMESVSPDGKCLAKARLCITAHLQVPGSFKVGRQQTQGQASQDLGTRPASNHSRLTILLLNQAWRLFVQLWRLGKDSGPD